MLNRKQIQLIVTGILVGVILIFIGVYAYNLYQQSSDPSGSESNIVIIEEPYDGWQEVVLDDLAMYIPLDWERVEGNADTIILKNSTVPAETLTIGAENSSCSILPDYVECLNVYNRSVFSEVPNIFRLPIVQEIINSAEYRGDKGFVITSPKYDYIPQGETTIISWETIANMDIETVSITITDLLTGERVLDKKRLENTGRYDWFVSSALKVDHPYVIKMEACQSDDVFDIGINCTRFEGFSSPFYTL